MTNFCKNCGTELKEGAKFCPNCGQIVDKAGTNATDHQDTNVRANTNATKNIKSTLLNNLVLLGAVIMLLGLFIGNFYTTNPGGGYIGVYEIKGFNIPFSGIWYGIILLISPIVLLISGKVNVLKKSEATINIGFSVASLILVFVLKSQISSEWGHYGSSSSLALGSYIYLLGNILTIVISGLKLAGFKTDAKSIEEAVKNRDISSLK